MKSQNKSLIKKRQLRQMSVLAFLCMNFSISEQVCIFCYKKGAFNKAQLITLEFYSAFVCRCFFVHGKFHVFFHAVFFAIKIIIVRTVSGISNRIFRIVTICAIEFFHQWYKALDLCQYIGHKKYIPDQKYRSILRFLMVISADA